VTKFFVINLVLVALAAGAAAAGCQVAGKPALVNDALLAAAVVLIASELSLVPLLLTRGADQGAVSQAGLLSTGVHMLSSAAIGWAVSSGLHRGQPFLYWLLAFYWLSLISVSAASVKAVRSAPTPPAAKKA